jgi:hypothetical protein
MHGRAYTCPHFHGRRICSWPDAYLKVQIPIAISGKIIEEAQYLLADKIEMAQPRL